MALRRDHCVLDSLGERKPLRPVFRGVWEFILGREHSRHSPEALIVVSERQGVVHRLVVIVLAHLMKHALRDDIVVARVPGEMPVINVCAHHGAAFPPVVVSQMLGWRPWKDAGDHARLVAGVEGHHVIC